MKTLPGLFRKDKNSGQALLLVLLVMSVILTVVLSVVAKSVTDVKITGYEEDALRAFSAAEAGVEETLLNAVPGTKSDNFSVGSADTSGYVADTTSPDVVNPYEYPEKLESGEIATIWFVSHMADNKSLTCLGKTCSKGNNLEVCWGTSAGTPPPDKTPAIEVVLYYDISLKSLNPTNDYSGVNFVTKGFDPWLTRRNLNNFDHALTGTEPCTFNPKYKYSTGRKELKLGAILPVNCNQNNDVGCLLMAKIRMLYNIGTGSEVQGLAVKVGSGSSDSLPSQGLEISSTGTSGESSRRVNVRQGYSNIPDIFNNALFSLKGL
jgi:hypothetical protein